jgi:hypothetical protein
MEVFMKKFLMLSLLFVPVIMLGMEEESKESGIVRWDETVSAIARNYDGALQEQSVYDNAQVEDYGGRAAFTKHDGTLFLSKKLAAATLNEENEGDESVVDGYFGEKLKYQQWCAEVEKRNKVKVSRSRKKEDDGKSGFGDWCKWTLSCYGEECDCLADEIAEFDGEALLEENIRERQRCNRFYQEKEQRMAKKREAIHDQAYLLLHKEMEQKESEPKSLVYAMLYGSMPEREREEGLKEIRPNPKNVGMYAYQSLSPAERDRLYLQERDEQKKLREEAKQQSTTRWQLRTSINDAKQQLIDMSGSAFKEEQENLLTKFRCLEKDCSRDLSKQRLSQCLIQYRTSANS